MNIIPAYLKRTWHSLLLLAAVCCLMSSCDNMVYDYEGDCSVPPVPSVTYRIKFRYDKNLKWADAFAHEVKSVHLYAFDKEGTLVWHRSERGDALAADDYAMTLDVPAGDYRLVAWCGLDNDGEHAESFTVPEVREGVTRIEQLKCSLNRMHDPSVGAYSNAEDGRLYPLFHGMLDVKLPASDNGGSYTYTMGLTKDTNHIRVILQNLSGEEVRAEDFTYRIEEENGLMNYDNKLLPDEMITYWPKLSAGTASLGRDDYDEPDKHKQSVAPKSSIVIVYNVAVADFFIGRLVPGRRTFLIINENLSEEKKQVAKIPITDFALMLKDGYYGDDMSDEDYLDRQDEYELVLFLDEERKWTGTEIIINSWKIVINDIDFGK